MSDGADATVIVESSVTETRSEGLLSSDSLSSGESLNRFLDGLSATRLDRYVLVEKVGAGAFGSVWSAFDTQLDRRVAIKLLFVRGTDSPQAELDTSLREAQMLAQVNHPNVVAIHDVRELEAEAVGPGGRRGLYIVMEFLAGSTLRAWLSQASRSWQEVVSVFAEAGQGLLAAHRCNLVHRDFKPANVMFGADGRVRVVDFGVAEPVRAARARGSGKRRVVGTPAYMAPEQHLGDAADARSDQYAFCVSLYEALYGRRPFRASNEQELAEAKLLGPPPLVRTAKVPARLQQVLQRGLALDPKERYPDMAALLDELLDDPVARRRRWLALGALLAVVAGAGYGLAQLQVRNAESCEAAPEVFAGLWDEQVQAELGAGLAGSEGSYASATRAKVEAGLEGWTQRWRASYQVACEAARASEGSFTPQSPARACLERARRRFGGLTGTLLEGEGELLTRAQDAVVELPRPEDCAAAQRANAEPSSSIAERRERVMSLEEEVARGRALRALGRHEQALELARASAEEAEALQDYASATEAMRLAADTLSTLELNEEALAASEEALRLAILADDAQAEAWALLRKLEIHVNAGQLEGAGAVAGLVSAHIDGERLGPALTIERDVRLAMLAGAERDYDAAEGLLTNALARAGTHYGEQHSRVATLHNVLGSTYLDLGRGEEGLKHYRAALDIRREVYGDHHHTVAASLNNVAIVLFDRGEMEAAGEYLREALEINAAVFGARSVKLIPYLMNLANLEQRLGRERAALAHQDRALKLGAENLPDPHPMLARMYLSRSVVRRSLELDPGALEDRRAALAMYEALYGPTHAETAVVMALVAESARDSGAAQEVLDEAERLEQLALTALSRELPQELALRGDALQQLVRILQLRGESRRALDYLEQRVAHELDTVGEGSSALAPLRVELVELLVELGQLARAQEVAVALRASFDAREQPEERELSERLERALAGEQESNRSAL